MTDNILTLLSARQTDRRPDAPALAGQDEQERWYDISWREFDRQIVVEAYMKEIKKVTGTQKND